MNFGYVRIGTFSPRLRVCDVEYNANEIIEGINIADNEGVQLLVFPDLSITGATAGNLYYSDTLLEGAKEALLKIAKSTEGKKMLVLVGLPIKVEGAVYDVACAINNRKILAFIPKSKVDGSCFSSLKDKTLFISVGEDKVPLSNNIIFADKNKDNFKVGVEIDSDIKMPICPSANLSLNGARVIANLASAPAHLFANDKMESFIADTSKRFKCIYAYSNAGVGESTTDKVYAGNSFIAENGNTLAKSLPFERGLTSYLVDLDYIDFSRTKGFDGGRLTESIQVPFDAYRGEFGVDRCYDIAPFSLNGKEQLTLTMQAEGLKKRVEHTNAKTLVIGLSGGLDSTLAILVCALAMDRLNRSRKDIVAVTMPCFGTTSRTFDNSVKLAKALGVTLKKVDIAKSVTRHLKDIDHDGVTLDATYENAQARERTQVLMDLANTYGGLVVGTGDLSELALGWATYNGDHMSMYGVNCSIPKTLVRRLVGYYADNCKGKVKAILYDVLDTPVSPELLPAKDSQISQKTEDIVGPYILHDFFLYYFIKYGFTPKKVYAVAVNSFKGEFDSQTILKWLRTFVRRFFSQQFKRSCLPDGVQATEISLSPRGGFNMPSDAVVTLWLKELDQIK